MSFVSTVRPVIDVPLTNRCLSPLTEAAMTGAISSSSAWRTVPPYAATRPTVGSRTSDAPIATTIATATTAAPTDTIRGPWLPTSRLARTAPSVAFASATRARAIGRADHRDEEERHDERADDRTERVDREERTGLGRGLAATVGQQRR